ncbi:MAG TPA: hypothetical protein VLL77_11225, partial [Anaerolineales bacterium]|nr:hypothetical protein [Anaerolineales bacterium]
MTSNTSGWRNRMRLVGVMTAKDIVEGIKNKNTLPAIISVLFLVAFYRYLPLITDAAELPQVRIWDTGDSTLPAFLENSLNLEARSGYESRDQLLRRVGRASTAELGLAIPTDFDAVVEAGGEPVIEAYLAYWVSPAKADELISLAERETARLLGRPVRIDLSEVRAYPTSEDAGPGAQVSLALIVVVVMVGVNMVPHLMLEEK